MKMKEKPKKENGERWLLTYSDLITLLMILFILLYAMSKVDQQKYEQLASSLSNALGTASGTSDGSSIIDTGVSDNIFQNDSSTPVDLGGNSGNTGSTSGVVATQAPTQPPEATITPEPTQGAGAHGGSSDIPGSLVTQQDMEKFQQFVNDILDDMKMGADIGTSMTARGLTITFKNDVFFDSGKDTLTQDMKDSLHKISRLINKVDNKVVIEGHTDNVPISSTNRFTSNWQLSSARAANVVEYLADQGYVDGVRLSAVGYGEFQPVASNKTTDGRSKNRRVDIVILYDATK